MTHSTNNRFTLLLPDWATYALINKDYTALGSEKLKALTKFEAELNKSMGGRCQAIRFSSAGLQACNELNDDPSEYCANVIFECFNNKVKAA